MLSLWLLVLWGVYVFALYSASLSLISLSILAVVSVFMLCDSSVRDALIGDAGETIVFNFSFPMFL